MTHHGFITCLERSTKPLLRHIIWIKACSINLCMNIDQYCSWATHTDTLASDLVCCDCGNDACVSLFRTRGICTCDRQQSNHLPYQSYPRDVYKSDSCCHTVGSFMSSHDGAMYNPIPCDIATSTTHDKHHIYPSHMQAPVLMIQCWNLQGLSTISSWIKCRTTAISK